MAPSTPFAAPTRKACAAALVLAAGSLCPGQARAFTIDGPWVEGCHERITSSALARAGWGADLPTWPSDDAHRRLLAGVPFPTADDVGPRELALLIGVRSPDVGELAVTDLDRLASVHAEPGAQHEHCLRESHQEGDAGNDEALAAARAFVLGEITAALGSTDTLEAEVERIEISLAFQGRTAVEVPRFPYRLGRALHTLQDSFPHTFRSEEGARVLSVHNWVDRINRRDFDEARDGFAHLGSRDACSGGPEAIARAANAEQATVELLEALSDPSGGRAGRFARADAVIDRWLVLSPGCNLGNDYCGTPDAPGPVVGCAATPSPSAGGAALLPLLLFLGWRRRSPRGSRSRSRVTLGGLLLGGLLLASPIHADEATPAAARAAPSATDGRSAGSEPASLERERMVAVSLAVSGAIESPAAAVAVGVRWFPDESWRIGFEIEHNPWFDIASRGAALGLFNAYASVQWDWLLGESARVGTRVIAGFSVLLFDLVGANAGQVGPMIGGTPIGVGFQVDDEWELRVDPELVLSVPQVEGIPIVNRQYRLTLTALFGL